MFKLKKNTIKILFVIFFIALFPLIPTGLSEYQQSFYLAGASSIVHQISKKINCNANISWKKTDSNYNVIIENLSEETYIEWELTFYKEKQMALSNLEETTNGWFIKGINLKPKDYITIPITLEVNTQEEEEEYLNDYFKNFVFLSSCNTKES